MNPIGMLCIGLSSGCGAGLVVLVNHLRVAGGGPAGQPERPVDELDAAPDRDTWDGDGEETLQAIGADLAKIREVREKANAARVDTLRMAYLKQRGEVPAR